MIANSRVIAVIPARGGSKSVPQKNIKLLGGKPLIVWAIDVAKQVQAIDRIIVSTDDEEISAISRKNGAEVYERPTHLATDEALVIDALKDLFRQLRSEGEQAGIMVLLEPTCPLRAAEDVKDCLDLMGQGFDSVATFEEAELNPHRAWKIREGRPEVFIPGAIPWLPRQKLPKAYQLNGAVYAFRSTGLEENTQALLFGNSAAVVMPKERSVDIDAEFDFELIESLIRKKKNV